LHVVVEDAAGRPVAGADVRARQIRQAFAFGTCVPADKLWSPQAEKYRQILTRLFNYATLENDLKWEALAGDWAPSFTLDNARRAIAWLREHGLAVRGHVLVWPGWHHLPRALRAHEGDPSSLRAAIEEHIRGSFQRSRGPWWTGT
jgi:GH35 family endo-1,4-beta-xylanase